MRRCSRRLADELHAGAPAPDRAPWSSVLAVPDMDVTPTVGARPGRRACSSIARLARPLLTQALMHPSLIPFRSGARLAPGVFLLSTLALTASGCWTIQASQERSECDRALEVVCGCGSIACDGADAPPIVAALRACDMDQLRDDIGFDLPICITSSSGYCSVLGGLTTSDPALCDVTCDMESACDLEAACHQRQHASCDLATSGAGGGK